ncbi:MAG TPA: hypothetical protein VF581_07895 [Flavobacterium sp.]
MDNFYGRLLQLAKNKGFKNINDFALNGLKYDSSSKLSRLKDPNKKPSVEILEDISNKFEDVDLHALITGRQLINARAEAVQEIAEPDSRYLLTKDEIILTQKELIEMQREKIQRLEEAKKGKEKERGSRTG